MNRFCDPLFLTVLSAKSRWVVKGSRMETGYGNTVGVRTDCYMLHPPPGAHPTDESIKECAQPTANIFKDGMKPLSAAMLGAVMGNVSRRVQ